MSEESKPAAAQGVRPAHRAVMWVAQALFTLVAITIFGAFMAQVHAAEPFAAPRAAEPVTATSAGSLVQVTLSLVLVLAAVFAAAWAMRRLRNFGRLGAGAIEVIADVAVGTKERAVLVQVGGQQVLLGVAPGRVNTLLLLAEPVVLSKPADGSSGNAGTPGAPQSPDFKAILKRSLGLS